MRHFRRSRSDVQGRRNTRGRIVQCEPLEGRLAPGDVLLGSALGLDWLGLLPEMGVAERADQRVSGTSTFTSFRLDDPLGAPPAGSWQDRSISDRSVGGLVGSQADGSPWVAGASAASAETASLLVTVGAALRDEGMEDPPDPGGIRGGRSETEDPALLLPYSLREWRIPWSPSEPHDVISDRDGIIWFTDIGASKIGRLDPFVQPPQFREFPLAAGRNPHGLDHAPDNGIWFTEQGGNRIGRIDRTTFEITEYMLPNANSGPHTPHYDGYGRVWFTQQSGNRIGRIDIYTGNIEQWTLPTPGSGPYGIVADPQGNGWFCEFGAGSNRIGRIDAVTGAIREFATPTANSGPRRLWFDSQGMLWITENRGNKLARFDPQTEQFREWNTPHAGGQPYAVTVDHTDQVWFTEFAANYMVSFNSRTEQFTSYAMPTTNERVRFIHVDPFDRVWYENNGNDAIGVVSRF